MAYPKWEKVTCKVTLSILCWKRPLILTRVFVLHWIADALEISDRSSIVTQVMTDRAISLEFWCHVDVMKC